MFFDKDETIRYTHGPGIDEPISIERNTELYYYHYDGLGSVTSLTDDQGKTVETYTYDSFGNLKRQGNKTKNSFTYTGREYDKNKTRPFPVNLMKIEELC